MSKRLASKSIPSKRRKRIRNRVSTSSEVFELARPPPSTRTANGMHIWHANVKQPTTTHKSKAPVSKSQHPPPVEHVMQLEEGGDTAGTPPFTAHSKRQHKCQHGNDSVSRSSVQYSTNSQARSPHFLDEDVDLGFSPSRNIGRACTP